MHYAEAESMKSTPHDTTVLCFDMKIREFLIQFTFEEICSDFIFFEIYIFGSGVVSLYKHSMHYAEAAAPAAERPQNQVVSHTVYLLKRCS